MAVGVMTTPTQANGFTQSGNGRDAPTSETDWPNQSNVLPPYLSVWLR